MGDNVTITSGAGATPPDGTVVATDDVSGVQYQRVKLDVGSDGASTPVTSSGLPVNDAGGSLTVDGTVAVSGTVTVNGSGVTQPISAAALPLPTGAATDTLQTAEAVLIGAVAETAPGTDTASSGLNGRLQRIAQRLTSLIALLPASLGQKASAASLAVTIASDQSAVPASQSGTWTVQPGNTANTTAWKVDGSAVVQPVSGTVTANVGTVPVTDNSGSLTVDAPVGTPVFTRLSDGTAALTTTGGRLSVDASAVAVPVTDNAGSLTVDAPVATPVFTRLSDGSAALVGQKAMASSLPVAIASDQSAIPASQSGTWTVQPGNTANTIAWKVDGSAVINKNGDSLGQGQYNFPAGFVRVTDEPRQLFYDPFDGSTVDVTNRWTAAFGLGAAVTPSQASGQLVVDAGATSTGWATLTAQVSLTPTVPAWLGYSVALNLTDGASLVSSGYRFWGVATTPTVPSIATPLTDAVGFEVSGGKMYAVVYAAGVRTAIQDMSAATGNASAPTDALNHRYIVYIRTDKAYWYVDALTTPVATSSFQSPAVQTLPLKYLAISGGAATTIQSPGVAAWDTGKNNTQLSDGTYPWRKATISSTGKLAVDTAGVATDASTTEPSTNLISGWDGLNVRAAFVQAIDGHNTLFVHDQIARRLLEEVLIELRINNVQMAKLLGPQALTQREMQPDQRLVN